MILDSLARSSRYHALHPAFARAFDLLANSDWTTLQPGRHEIDGDRIYVLVDHTEGRGREGTRLEAHRRYLDIQFTIDGCEEIGWMSLNYLARGLPFLPGTSRSSFRRTRMRRLPAAAP